jgi:hypothetical protein
MILSPIFYLLADLEKDWCCWQKKESIQHFIRFNPCVYIVNQAIIIMNNRIVIRYANGKIWKGTTANFSPNKDIFHMTEMDNGEYHEIDINDLKAVFFVKTFDGDSNYHERIDIERVGLGKKIMVHFNDNEIMVGYTQGYSPNRAGFILFPADPDCNNEKVFVIVAATKTIKFF